MPTSALFIIAQVGNNQLSIMQLILLFIPGTFSIAPYKTVSYLRGGTRHVTYFEDLSMSSRTTNSTTEWTVDWCLSSPIFKSQLNYHFRNTFLDVPNSVMLSGHPMFFLQWVSSEFIIHLYLVILACLIARDHSCLWKELQRFGSSVNHQLLGT